MRLIEATNPYVESLQRDEHVGVLLGLLTPFYGAALFQPAMLSVHSGALVQKRACMSLVEFADMVNEHWLAPIAKRVFWLLFFSFDWLGNPLQLMFGVLAGLRELGRQPYQRGLVGIPVGMFI